MGRTRGRREAHTPGRVRREGRRNGAFRGTAIDRPFNELVCARTDSPGPCPDRNITLIDSPGILSGEKQRLGRDYDYQVRFWGTKGHTGTCRRMRSCLDAV